MIKNYFKIAWRNIVRHRSYSSINIVGLAIGVAACLLIFVVVQFELSFDTFQPNYKNIYHIATAQKQDNGMAYTPGTATPATEALRLDLPQAKVASINANYGCQITIMDNSASNADGGKNSQKIRA